MQAFARRSIPALVVIALIVVIALGRRVVVDAERMRLVAEAEHELRGPLQAITFAPAWNGSGSSMRTPENSTSTQRNR